MSSAPAKSLNRHDDKLIDFLNEPSLGGAANEKRSRMSRQSSGSSLHSLPIQMLVPIADDSKNAGNETDANSGIYDRGRYIIYDLHVNVINVC